MRTTLPAKIIPIDHAELTIFVPSIKYDVPQYVILSYLLCISYFSRRYKYYPQDVSNSLFYLQGYRPRITFVQNNKLNYNFANFKIMFLSKLGQARLRQKIILGRINSGHAYTPFICRHQALQTKLFALNLVRSWEAHLNQ
jgi:hypothetical protein